MFPFDAIKSLWYQRLRRIDLEVLWPICKSKAATLDEAKFVFVAHCFNDKAWLWMGDTYIYWRVSQLE